MPGSCYTHAQCQDAAPGPTLRSAGGGTNSLDRVSVKLAVFVEKDHPIRASLA